MRMAVLVGYPMVDPTPTPLQGSGNFVNGLTGTIHFYGLVAKASGGLIG